jgi:excisionase family DNA binding protein
MDHEQAMRGAVEKLIGVKEIADRTGLEVSWIYAQAAAKKIPYLKCGKYLRFRWSEIELWLEAQRQGPGVERRAAR